MYQDEIEDVINGLEVGTSVRVITASMNARERRKTSDWTKPGMAWTTKTVDRATHVVSAKFLALCETPAGCFGSETTCVFSNDREARSP